MSGFKNIVDWALLVKLYIQRPYDVEKYSMLL